MSGLLLTRAARHLAAHPFGSDWWLHRPRLVGWLVKYLDIYLFYVYVGDKYPSIHVAGALIAAANQPHVAAAVDQRDRQTDGHRTVTY